MKKLIIATIISGGVFFFLSCENSFDILEKIETEVKIANDRFLAIQKIVPENNQTGINPGVDIQIHFDRAVDMETVNQDTISISNDMDEEQVWINPSFESLTKTLTLSTEGLDISTKYIVSINGVKGIDGSELHEDYVWSFTTGVAPAGSIVLMSNNQDSQPEYTDSATVTVNLTGNDVATRYYVDNSRSTLDPPPPHGDAGWRDIDGSATISDHVLSGEEEENTVYVLFRYFNPTTSEYTYSIIKEDLITLDLTDPVVDAGVNRLVNTETYQEATVTESNIFSYEWSGDGLSFSSGSSKDTSIDAGDDGEYTATLTVRDMAGRSSSDSMGFIMDTAAPAGTTALINGDNNFSTDGVVNFAFTFADNRSPQTSCRYRLYDSETGYHPWADATASSMNFDVPFSDEYNNAVCYVGVEFQDEAGNSSTLWGDDPTTFNPSDHKKSYDDVNIDNMPVTAPSVSFSDNTYTAGTITLDPRPTWSWDSAGNGKGVFRYSYDETSWTNTEETSFTPPSALDDGVYTLYVQERDYDDDYSISGTQSVRVAEIIPYDGQTGVTTLRGNLTIAWREVSPLDTYSLQVYTGKLWTTVASGITTNTYMLSNVQSRTTYTWRLLVHPYRFIDYTRPESGSYSFMTK